MFSPPLSPSNLLGESPTHLTGDIAQLLDAQRRKFNALKAKISEEEMARQIAEKQVAFLEQRLSAEERALRKTEEDLQKQRRATEEIERQSAAERKKNEELVTAMGNSHHALMNEMERLKAEYEQRSSKMLRQERAGTSPETKRQHEKIAHLEKQCGDLESALAKRQEENAAMESEMLRLRTACAALEEQARALREEMAREKAASMGEEMDVFGSEASVLSSGMTKVALLEKKLSEEKLNRQAAEAELQKRCREAEDCERQSAEGRKKSDELVAALMDSNRALVNERDQLKATCDLLLRERKKVEVLAVALSNSHSALTKERDQLKAGFEMRYARLLHTTSVVKQ